MSKFPLQIGITGGIGAGKSTVCRIFTALGVPLYSADDRAKWLMSNDDELKSSIIEQFTEHAYKGRQLDREHLARHVFHDQKELDKLNALVHPAVAKDYQRWVSNTTAPYIIKEAALIYETGGDQYLDKTILIVAPEETKINRVLARDPHRERQQVQSIIARQIPVAQAMIKADYILYNDEKSLLIPQVLKLHRMFSHTNG